MQERYGFVLPQTGEMARIQEYFTIFDDFFFFGSLRSRTTFEIIQEPSPFMGSSLVERQKHCRMAKVQLSLRRNSPNESDETRFERVVGTILHEQLHSYINILRCRCPSCMSNQRESLGNWNQDFHGHGWLWSILAFTVEQICNSTFGFSFELGIRDSVTHADVDVLYSLRRFDVLTRILQVQGFDSQKASVILEEGGEVMHHHILLSQ